MKKIVFINSSFKMGGPSRVISIWANYFHSKGYQVEIFSNIKSQVFYKLDKSIKYSIIGIEEFKPKNKFKTLYKLYKLFYQRKNEIIIFNKGYYIPYLYILKKLHLIDCSIKLIYFVHGGSSNFKTIYSNLHTFMIIRSFDFVFALINDYDSYNYRINKSIKRVIVDFFIPNIFPQIKNKINYINNPVPFQVNGIANYENKQIIAVGRFDKVKGFDLLLKAWSLISSDYSDWKLILVGEGQEEENLKNLVINLGIDSQVVIMPSTENIESLYLSSSIYAMSSIIEGYGMVIIEAMECGLPIVAFKNVGASYLVKDGENGFLSAIGDIESFSNHLSYLIKNDSTRKLFGIKSKELAKKFTIENITKSWDIVIDNEQ